MAQVDSPPVLLTKTALEDYEERGYHIEENVWTSFDMEQFIRIAGYISSVQDIPFTPLMQPHRTNLVFNQALRNPTIVAIAEQLCGGQVSGLQSVWYYGAPGTPGFNAHQDSWFVEPEDPDAFVSAWSPMQDVTPEMGGLVGYPRSHRLGQLEVVEVNRPGSANQDVNATKEEVVLPEGYGGIDLYVPKGAVLFMHSHFVHSSNGNKTDKFRRALLLTYIRQGEKFRPGNTAKREEVNVYD